VTRFTLELSENEHGNHAVLRWLRGIGVCRTAYGEQLEEGLFEFRLRHDGAEILRSVGKRRSGSLASASPLPEASGL